MKLLFDENLSPNLVVLVRDVFPDSVHVREHGLAPAPDQDVWEFARLRSLTIVSKDDDFREVSFLRGQPPKIIGILLGNCSTRAIADALRASAPVILAFEADQDAAYLPITRQLR